MAVSLSLLLVAFISIALPPGYADALAEARRLVKAEQYDAAAEEYTRALRFVPDDAVAMSGRGFARLMAGRLSEARRDLDSASGWASGPKVEAMVAHNLRLLRAAEKCQVAVVRDVVHGVVSATARAAFQTRLQPALYEALSLRGEDFETLCAKCTTPSGIVIDSDDASEAFVMMRRGDGQVIVSPRLAAGVGGRCGARPSVTIVSQTPLVVHVSEELQEAVEEADWSTSCVIAKAAEHDYVLDRETFDVLLRVTRSSHRRRYTIELGDSQLTPPEIAVNACGQRRVVTLPARR